MASSDLLGLVATQAAARDRLTRAAVRAAISQARTLDFYDTAAISAAADTIVAHVESAQRQTAALTDAYLARTASQITGRTTQPVGPADVAALRAGVTHPGVYGRLADHYRYLVSTGVTDTQARLQTLQRAEAVATTDVDLAMRAQVARFTRVHHLQYRRVIHPELSREGTCGLCIGASDRIYSRGDLMPIHARCKCEVLPVSGSKDPGQAINVADLTRLYDTAGGTGAAKLKRVRVAVRHHSELGPILTQKGHRWRGPAELDAA